MDDIGLSGVELQYRINGGRMQVLPLVSVGKDSFAVELDGQPVGTRVDSRMVARDDAGNETFFPGIDLPMQRFEVISLSGSPVLFVALPDADGVGVIDLGTGEAVGRIPTGRMPQRVLMTPDARYVFVANSGGAENRVTVIETATHQVVRHLEVGTAPYDLALSADGQAVYVTNVGAKSISVIDVGTLTVRSRIRVPISGHWGPYGIAVHPDGKRLYVTDYEGHQVLIVDAASGASLGQIPVLEHMIEKPRSLIISADGKRVYVSGAGAGAYGGGGVLVIDTESESVVSILRLEGALYGLRLSPDGSRLYGTDASNAQMIVIDGAHNRVVKTVKVLPEGAETRALFVSGDGSKVYVANQQSKDGVVFDAESFGILSTLRFEDRPHGIAVRAVGAVGAVFVQGRAGQADFDGNGKIDFGDFFLFVAALGAEKPDMRFDLNGDGQVNVADFLFFANLFALR